MGLRGKLLLKVSFISIGENPRIIINKESKNIDYLLPFSCTSLFASQLTVLTDYRPFILIEKVESFAKNKIIRYVETIFDSFDLEIFKKSESYIYNQYHPLLNPLKIYDLGLKLEPDEKKDDEVEEGAIDLIVNYIKNVYEKSDSINRDKMIEYLYITSRFFEEVIYPIRKNISIFDTAEWTRMAATSINFNSEIFNRWRSDNK